MKVCSRCHIEKDDSDFRTRTDKRPGRECIYLNNECKQCDKERASIYYEKCKDDPAFKKKNCDRVNKYRETNHEKIKMRRSTREYAEKHAKWNLGSYYRMKDIIAHRMKTKRQTPEYKQMMREYRERAKEAISKKSKITKRRWSQKHMENLTDEYISMKLFNCIDREFIRNHPELIEAKRLQILIKRKTKNYGKN